MSIREYTEKDTVQILTMYQKAFAGFPWFENLSKAEVLDRWMMQSSHPGFRCFVMDTDNTVAGAIWWDKITIKRLQEERGKEVAAFVDARFPGVPIIWEREVIVHPEFHRRGIATRLRTFFIKTLKASEAPVLVLTRMRDDNSGIITIAERLGFQRTGIRMRCTLKPTTNHEYWYLFLG